MLSSQPRHVVTHKPRLGYIYIYFFRSNNQELAVSDNNHPHKMDESLFSYRVILIVRPVQHIQDCYKTNIQDHESGLSAILTQ